MIYLVHTAAEPEQVRAEGLADDLTLITGALIAVDTTLTQSQLYHGLKRLQPPDVPLVVAPLTETPKLKSVEHGAVSWLRERLA